MEFTVNNKDMNKLKLSTVGDGIFIYLVCFFISYAFIKSKVVSIASATILSSMISAILTFAFIYYLSKKDRLKSNIANKNQLLKAFNTHLYLLPDKEIVKLISNYLIKIGVAFEVKNSNFYFYRKTILQFHFTPDKTTLSTCINFYKKTPKNYNLVILSCEYDDSVKEFFSDFERIKLYTSNDLYTALENENLLPTLQLPKKDKLTLNSLIGVFLQRKNVKKFFLWGVLLMLFSTVTYYKLFYLILGTSFLLLSAYLKFFIKQN